MYCTGVWADSSGTLESEAARMYQEGNYTKAVALYNEVLEQGLESATLYYNLGNSHYKQGEIARAILNYERALLLRPGYKDAKYNLAMAQRGMVDKINVLPELFLVRWYNAVATSLTADQWGYVSVVSFLLFLAMVILFFHATSMGMKKTGFTVALVSLFLTVMVVLFAQKQYYRMTDRNAAVVMTPSVVVRGAPDVSGTELFVIHEGLKVQVQEKLGSWYNVRMVDGNEGWIQEKDLERI